MMVFFFLTNKVRNLKKKKEEGEGNGKQKQIKIRKVIKAVLIIITFNSS